jgi:hypothetical protein
MRTGGSKLNRFAVFVCLAGGLVSGAFAQNPPNPPKHEPPKTERPVVPEPPEPSEHRDSSEKALAVDPNVNLQLSCISEARVTVNGWQRDEIRVFIRNGTNIAFKVHEKNPKNGKPIWVVIRKLSGGPSPSSDCISGERIDIEVPSGASLKINGREIETRIDSVKKVEITSLSGNVALRNVSGGIKAETFDGNVTVENSSGQIALKTSSGNIVAFGVSPGQVGDVFKAGTSNGLITMQKVDHRQIDANSVTGDLLFDGKFLPGGIYSFKTSEGNVRLVIPESSSCRIVAWYGFGTISSQIPMKTMTRDVSEGGKSLRAEIGEGDATVNLTTNRGRITIVKQADQPSSTSRGRSAKTRPNSSPFAVRKEQP